MSKRFLLFLLLALVALVLPGTAQAKQSNSSYGLNLDQVNNHLTASWSNPDERDAYSIQFTDRLDFNQDFSFDDSLWFDTLSAEQESYTVPFHFAGSRTYFAHVGVIPANCDPVQNSDCVEWGAPQAITLPRDPRPAPPAVTTAGGRLNASWTLLPETVSFGFLVAVAPDVVDDGRFSQVNITFEGYFESQTTTTYSPARVFAPGTYWAQIVAYYPGCRGLCEDLFSPPVPVTITAAQVNTSGAPGLDKSVAFASLKSSSKQKVDKLTVSCSMAEAGTLSATGTVSVPGASKVYKFKTAKATATGGKTVKLKLKLPKKGLKAVKKALKRKKTLKAKLTITAKDNAGNAKVEKRTVKLKP